MSYEALLLFQVLCRADVPPSWCSSYGGYPSLYLGLLARHQHSCLETNNLICVDSNFTRLGGIYCQEKETASVIGVLVFILARWSPSLQTNQTSHLQRFNQLISDLTCGLPNHAN